MSTRYFLVLGLLALAGGVNASPLVAGSSHSVSISSIQLPTIVEEGKKDGPPRGPRPDPGPRDGGDGDR